MYLTYVDDAGDPGTGNSPTRHLVLAGVMVHERDWITALDGLIDLRRRLKERYGIAVRRRLKTYDFIRGTGSLRGLGLPLRSRRRLLEGIFRYQAKELPVRVFAVAIAKSEARERTWDPQEAAWTFLLQRLQRFCEEKGERTMVITEAELAQRTRQILRRMRRHHRIPFLGKEGDRRVEVRRLIEDPMVASARESYWLQLAGWNAHAALRSRHVEPRDDRTLHLWDLLGTQRIEEVSRLRRGPPGIVLYP